MDILLMVAVVTSDGTLFLVYDMKESGHRFVVRNAVWIVASDNAPEFIGEANLLFLHNLVVPNDGQRDVGGNNAELVQFRIGEEAVSNLDDTLGSHLVALEVKANGDLGSHLTQMQQVDDIKQAIARNMVDNSSVVKGGNNQFLSLHRMMVLSFFTCSRLIPNASQMRAWRTKSPLRAC